MSDASGSVKAFSPVFQLLDPPGVTISKANHNMTVDKGETVRIEWKFKSKPFPVRGKEENTVALHILKACSRCAYNT